jgi:hypothetical protein
MLATKYFEEDCAILALNNGRAIVGAEIASVRAVDRMHVAGDEIITMLKDLIAIWK